MAGAATFSESNVDEAFTSVLPISEPALIVWRIIDMKPVPVQGSDVGQFYAGDSYICLSAARKSSAVQFGNNSLVV